ncbi:MAG: hypothetical protein IK093_18225, partial [Ruminiclostridium sp.]|nr:hypothetical protein [Ruminiclostridium sp.]
MGRIKRLTAAVISAVMLIVCAVPACAELISGTYRSLLSRSLTAADGTFFYTDDYFSHPGSDSDPHLRTASLQLALTAFGAVNETNNHKYTDELLTAAGFTDISAEDMDISPTPDTVGSVIAHKSTEYGEIVAAAVRGGYYGAEWANSLDVGYSGSASGLSAAAKKLVMRIVSYERTHGITGAKIWITGYSRGGGISDLAGRYINEQLSELRMTADDLYVYTFEATAAGDAPTGYKNIHNVRNTNDIMAMLYPASWGLYCSGTDEPLSGSDEHVRRKYFSLTADGYIAEDGSTVSVAVLARETIDWAKQLVPRETFARYSPSITAATVIFASRNSEDAKRVADWFSDIARSVLKSHYVALGTLTAMPENTNMYRKALNRITSDLCDRL